MLRSLYSGISGLRSHQTMMDVTGNNISNVNTVGFKTSSTVFQDTLSQLVQAAGAPQGDQGGTNPAQVGLGVRVAGITTNFTQGAAQLTGRSTDLMINGDGFFVVNAGNEQMYTRAGAFNFDGSGKLVTVDGSALQGWSADAAGVINTNGGVGDIRLPTGTQMAPKATTALSLSGNFASDAATGAKVNTTITTYDALGTATDVAVVFTKTSATGATPVTWTGEIPAKPASAGPPAVAAVPAAPLTGTLSFDANGKLPAAGATLTMPGGIQVVATQAGLTGYSGNGVSTAKLAGEGETGGYAAGTLQSFTLGPDGTLTGVFSNELKQDLGRVAMANFANPAGLEKAGQSQYRVTGNSGDPQVGTAGTNGRGTLTGGALEMSNVDLSQEFTNLIVAQRGFQSNSRVITTSDELLQELVNLKR